MSATAEKKGKRKAGGNGKKHHGVYHRDGYAPSPDATGTTTPVGIAANDPAAIAARWDAVYPKIRDLLHVPKGQIAAKDHLLVSGMCSAAFEPKLSDVLLAESLVQLYSASLRLGGEPNPENEPQRRRSPENGSSAKAGSRTLSRVSLDWLVRHPDNRHPTAEAIDARARSIEAHGLEHPPTVRRLWPGHPDIPKGFKHPVCWQILSGETRVLALRKIGRASSSGGEIDAEVKQCSDAAALEYLARDNAERTDLDPIEKAALMRRLCEPTTDGGAGMTTQEVASLYGLKDGSSVSNLIRLLELPKVWQERVRSGELPQSFARLLLPYVHAPKLMDAIDAEWVKDHGPKAKQHQRDGWETRNQFEETLWGIICDSTRPADGKTPHHYDYREVGSFGVYEPRLFELTDELRQKLGVVTIEHSQFIAGKKVKMELATDAKAFDELNVPLVKAKLAKKTKASAAKGGREDKPAPPKLTPAQVKAREKEKAEQLARRIDAWRHRWIASLLLMDLDFDHELCLWVTLCVADNQFSTGGEEDVRAVLEKLGARTKESRFGLFAQLQQLSLLGRSDFRKTMEAGVAEIARGVLMAAAAESGLSPLEHDELDALAVWGEIDLAGQWNELQTVTGRAKPEETDGLSDAARYEAFYQLHQNAQLDALGDELGVHVRHVSGKEQKIKLLVGCTRQLKLPKAIRPLAATGTGKKKGRGSRGGHRA